MTKAQTWWSDLLGLFGYGLARAERKVAESKLAHRRERSRAFLATHLRRTNAVEAERIEMGSQASGADHPNACAKTNP